MADIFLHVNGEQKGPYSPEHVRAMLAAGEVAPDTLAWHEGLSEWSKVSAVLGPPPPPAAGVPPPPPALPAGKGMSGWLIALIVCAGLTVLCLPCCCGVALGPITNGIKKAKENMALQQAHAIGLAMMAYANDHNGNYPDASEAPAPGSVVTISNGVVGATRSTEVFQVLLDGKYITDPALFYFAMPGKVRPVGDRLSASNVCFDVTAGLTASSGSGVPLVYPTGYTVIFGQNLTVTRGALAPFDGFIAFYTGGMARYLKITTGQSADLGPLDRSLAASLRQLKP
jgi:hypothetical protein